jgi:NAD(P)-dependent dehydrogenase (short-subunit alcohol dehydrogenase family)
MERFHKKVCMITGAASGLGRALCEELGHEGASVIAVDINAEGAAEIEKMICNESGQACSFKLDVTQFENFDHLIAEIIKKFNRIDYIFNNAGIAINGEMSDLTYEDWKKVIDVNLMGVIYGTLSAYKAMVRQGFGHIVNISSLAGLIGYPMSCPYATAKFGVVGLSTSLRREAIGLGIKVSVVCPGYIDTGIFDASKMINANKQQIMESLPFKLMNANVAARKILEGVIKNKSYIVFPFYAKLLWWLQRINPILIQPLGNESVKNFRSARLTTETD